MTILIQLVLPVFLFMGAIGTKLTFRDADTAADVLSKIQEAHSASVSYEIEGWIMAPAELISSWRQEARDWYASQPVSKVQSARLGSPMVGIDHRKWFGDTRQRLRHEWSGVGSGGDPSRSTTASIWTNTMHIEGIMSHGTPNVAKTLDPITLEDEARWREQNIFPTSLWRADKGGYIEAVRYALRLLEGDPQTISEVDSDKALISARSERYQVALYADADTGEVETIIFGKGRRRYSQHSYEGRFDEPLFPARHPLRDFSFHFNIEGNNEEWWLPRKHKDETEGGYYCFTVAKTTPARPELFEWNDPDFDRSKVPDASTLNAKRETIAKAKPVFVPSKTNPGRVVPNTPKSRMKTILLASGIALLVGGGILAIRRRAG